MRQAEVVPSSISWLLVFQIEEAWLGCGGKNKHRKEGSASFLFSGQLVKVSCLTDANKPSVKPIRIPEVCKSTIAASRDLTT